MKKGYTAIKFLLDRSGSMDSLKEDVIGGTNRLIRDQQNAEGKCKFTLVQFDYSPYSDNFNVPTVNFGGQNLVGYEIIYNSVDIKDVQPLTDKVYIPRGMTAYLDALGKTIEDAGKEFSALPEDERPEKVVVVVYTDGLENASRKFTKSQIAEMIKLQTEVYKWEFVFLGANMDAVSEGSSLGVAAASAATYTASSVGVARGFEAVSENLLSYRSGSAKSMKFSDFQKRSLVQDDE